MLQPLLLELASKRIILASSSPRRIEILRNIKFPFEVIPSTYEENLDPKNFPTPYEFAIETAKQKALEVGRRFGADEAPNLIIGADTVVTYQNEVYGKPKNKTDAFAMLKRFSGQIHSVYTGFVFCISKDTGGSKFELLTFHEKTDVLMAPLSDEIISAYIETGEPMDKAGSYGIQGLGGTLVESIHGDYYNVMGFPLHRFCKEIFNLYHK